MEGQVFTNWRVLNREANRRRNDRWLCQCLGCGRHVIVEGRNLRNGTSTQCRSCAKRIHGHSRMIKGGPSKEFNSWQNMIRRCTNRKHISYKYYGARGITIVRRWRGLNGFTHFLADMGRAPTPRHTIERLDNNGPYCNHNCCWATRTAQARNRRDNLLITAFGLTLTTVAWEELTGIPHQTIRSRLRMGWTPKEAVGCQLRTHGPHARIIKDPTI